MAYTTMKKLIDNANAKRASGAWTEDEYSAYRESAQTKLDVFFAGGRLTQGQYEELSNSWNV